MSTLFKEYLEDKVQEIKELSPFEFQDINELDEDDDDEYSSQCKSKANCPKCGNKRIVKRAELYICYPCREIEDSGEIIDFDYIS